jgi:hypothetical protein
MNKPASQPKGRRIFWRVLGVAALLLVIAGAVLAQRLRHRLPPGMMLDLRAGIAARNIPDADARFQKYLEGRYGPMTDAANRQKAFLDFFNVEHVKALQWLVKHSPEDRRQANINATARWLEHYRESLTGQERADVCARLQSPEGRTMLQQATAQYNSQDVQYRGQTVPVISQLLITISSLQKP